jgi:hypothetical protein
MKYIFSGTGRSSICEKNIKMYLKNIIGVDEGGGTVYLDMKRIHLWDSVSKVIIYVEFYERKGIPYAVE